MILEDRLDGQLELFPEEVVTIEEVKTYKIPRRTSGEDLSFKGGQVSWIRDFCRMNDLPLPKGLTSKNTGQVRGLYRGMLNTYGIVEYRDIIKR
jgi:hypothetical protein